MEDTKKNDGKRCAVPVATNDVAGTNEEERCAASSPLTPAAGGCADAVSESEEVDRLARFRPGAEADEKERKALDEM